MSNKKMYSEAPKPCHSLDSCTLPISFSCWCFCDIKAKSFKTVTEAGGRDIGTGLHLTGSIIFGVGCSSHCKMRQEGRKEQVFILWVASYPGVGSLPLDWWCTAACVVTRFILKHKSVRKLWVSMTCCNSLWWSSKGHPNTVCLCYSWPLWWNSDSWQFKYQMDKFIC